MAILPQKTNTLWIDSLRRWGQWLGQFPGHCKTGIAGMVAWMMAAGVGLFRWLLTIVGWAGSICPPNPSAKLAGNYQAQRDAPDLQGCSPVVVVGWAGIPSAMLRTGFLPAHRFAPNSAWANDRAVCPLYKVTRLTDMDLRVVQTPIGGF